MSNRGEPARGFVVLEGPVGAGKTTVQRALADQLRSEDYSVATVGEFSNTEFGRRLGTYFDEYQSREFPFLDDPDAPGRTELAAVASQLTDLALAVERELVPALAENDFVLKERFLRSTRVLEPLIYESSYGDPAPVADLVDAFERTLPVLPDRVFYLDVPRHERLRRIREETDVDSHHDEGFKRIESRFEELDGMTRVSNERPVEETVAEIRGRLAPDPPMG